MTERRKPQHLINNYRKTIAGLAQISIKLSLADQELTGLDAKSGDYQENILRLDKRKQCLSARALPVLTIRRGMFEGEIYCLLAKSEQKKTLEIFNAVKQKQTPRAIFENTLIALASQHVRSRRTDPDNPTGDRNCTILVRGKEIVILRRAIITKKMLGILDKTSRDNPISILQLAKLTCGKEIPSADDISKTRSTLYSLRKKYDLTIATINVSRKKYGDRRSGAKVLYYLTDKDASVKTDNQGNAINSVIPLKKEILTIGESKSGEVAASSASQVDQGNSGAEKKDSAVQKESEFNLSFKESELYVIAKILSYIRLNNNGLLTFFNINIKQFDADEIASLISRNNIEVKRINEENFWRDNISSVRKKLYAYAVNRKIYPCPYETTAKALFKCFETAKIDNNYWDRFLAIQPNQTEPRRGIKVGMGV